MESPNDPYGLESMVHHRVIVMDESPLHSQRVHPLKNCRNLSDINPSALRKERDFLYALTQKIYEEKILTTPSTAKLLASSTHFIPLQLQRWQSVIDIFERRKDRVSKGLELDVLRDALS